MLTQVLQTYPQPIAYAYGRVVRAGSEIERLDQILRCAEVTTRYLAALAIASFAARQDTSIAPPEALADFKGSLSFGHFLTVVQAIANLPIRHPLQSPLSLSFKQRNNPAAQNLVALLNIRNELGHDLSGLSKARASQIFQQHRPQELLEAILSGVEPLAGLPLFLVEQYDVKNKVLVAVRLRLMGEQSEPIPDQVALSEGFAEKEQLYVGARDGVLRLHPLLLWGLELKRATNSIYFLHRTNDHLEYSSLIQAEQPSQPPAASVLRGLLRGESRPLEPVTLHDGRSFLDEWVEQREAILSGSRGITQTIPWDTLDQKTIKWYAAILRSRTKAEEAQPVKLIRERLLDGRGEVNPDEWRQLKLLFGPGPSTIRREIGRDVLDLRVRQSPEERWTERLELAENLLETLRQAVEFIGQHNPLIKELSVDDFQKPAGSVDYVAVREALINLMIHQDYTDPRTVAQIELEPHRTTMVNAGAALVSTEELLDGGTSTARNPLVARALKLIGFAELAGSGLREAHRLWRNARRQPIVVASDDANNRFRIVLDSRPLKVVADTFWQQHLGVKLSPEQAQVLSILSASLEGMSFGELCSGTGFHSKDLQQMGDFLAMQQLIDRVEDQYRLKAHLIELAKQRKTKK